MIRTTHDLATRTRKPLWIVRPIKCIPFFIATREMRHPGFPNGVRILRSLKALVPFSLLLSLCIARLTTAQSPILLPDSELILISDGFKFTEGPAADSNGDVLFTDQPNDQIVKYSFHTGEVSTWLKPAGRSNGLYYASEKSLIACADHQNELW